MRYLIVSDIHANWEALEAVLADASGSYDSLLCCGDLVGYGADPDRAANWARQAVTTIVRGNHDKVCASPEELESFNPAARTATLWTIQNLSPENLSFVANLPKGPALVDRFHLVHGSPLDEDEYLVSRADVEGLFGYLEVPLTFFGHTHMQGGFQFVGKRVRRIPQTQEEERESLLELEPDSWYLLNPGSVGQPRDQDPRTSYAIYDSEARTVQFVRVSYDIETAQRKIMRAGLPALLARRLAIGR